MISDLGTFRLLCLVTWPLFGAVACAPGPVDGLRTDTSPGAEPIAPVFVFENREAELCSAEVAFAAAFAARDLAAFSQSIAEESVFAGSSSALRGRESVLAVWSGFFETEVAPFSWRPSRCIVGPDGDLGITTGPVSDTEGNPTGAFSSVWRRSENGQWRIIFDSSPPCPVCAR